jgi:DNA-binding CsgD family transcriptional regulator
MRTVVGRERELATIEGLLDNGLRRYSALLLSGEAGIGKTTVWQEAVRLGEEAGYRVLRCRPAQAEAKLGHASLADLLEPVDESVISSLPDPQRQAVDGVLLRSSARSASSPSRAVAAGCLTILRRLAEQKPLLIAIDDVQWLDRASEAALAFAVRRLEPNLRVAIIAALRQEASSDPNPLGLQGLPEIHLDRLVIGPLSLSAIYHVIHDRLGVVLPRPTLQRIEEVSGGNPLLAVELARALVDAGERPGPGEPLPVPDEIVALFAARLGKLPLGTRDAMLAASLLSEPTIGLLDRVVGESAGLRLEPAFEADLVEIRGDRVRFAHPLIGGALVASAAPSARRTMHRRLAEIVPSREERARHLALASDGADETVAAGLEEAAVLAEGRGAPEDASDLLELAWRLTPVDDVDARARRRLEHGRVLVRAGDVKEATALLDDVIAGQTSGPLRARALEARAHIHWVAGTAAEAEACCTEALEHVGDDLELRARVLVTLARVTMDTELILRRSQAAVEFLERLDAPDPGLLSEALVGIAGAEYYLGNELPWDVVERGLELERIAASPSVGDRMSAALGTWLKYGGDFHGARHWLELTRQTALDEGDEGSLPYALSHLPQLELWTGNWARAETLALDHLELAETTGQTLERLTAIYSLTLVHAHMGRVDETRERLAPALVEAEQADPWNLYQLLSVLGFLELSCERPTEAVEALGRAFDLYQDIGAGDTPAVYENYPEALVATGDLVRAREIVDLYERRASKALALAPALRCRALVAEAEGDLDAAVAALAEALVLHEQVAMPFSRARTLLVLGRVRRRVGERRAARQALDEALAVFEELGAPRWADRTRDELARVPSRRAAASDALTPTEERVAALVAEGRTNKEVAQGLFLSEKTVEANLTRIYRKLGVRSRAGLATRLASSQGGERATP